MRRAVVGRPGNRFRFVRRAAWTEVRSIDHPGRRVHLRAWLGLVAIAARRHHELGFVGLMPGLFVAGLGMGLVKSSQVVATRSCG
jgi:hypothetical protein